MHTITVDRSPQPTLENKKLQLRIRFRKFSFKFLSLVSKTIAFHWKEILDLTSLDLTFMGESTIGNTGEKVHPHVPQRPQVRNSRTSDLFKFMAMGFDRGPQR